MLTFNTFKTALNAISLRLDALKKSFDAISKKVPEPDWNENDPNSKNYVKNRTHREEVETVDIVGETYRINAVLNGAHDTIEFGLGQIWDVNPDRGGEICGIPVRRADDGVLYIGDPNLSNPPWYITDTTISLNSSFYNMMNPSYFDLTCVSGIGKRYIVHPLNIKYIPDEVCRKNELPVKSGEGRNSTIQGEKTTASGNMSHAEGAKTTASGYCSHAEGYSTNASGYYSHAEGNSTKTSGDNSHAEGYETNASGSYSHAEGFATKASSDYQHVQGKYNVADTTGKYTHIVGNGASDSARSNAHTLDWKGNAWFAGTVEGTKLILRSATSGSTKQFEITVDDSGTISAKEITS